MTKLRVFLVDDHAALREGLRLLVDAQTDMSVMGQAGDGREALRMIADCAPDVIVVDVTMPDIGGAQFTERLRARCPDLRVVALTRHTDPGYMRRMFEAGASGYVTKRAAAEELFHDELPGDAPTNESEVGRFRHGPNHTRIFGLRFGGVAVGARSP